MPHSLSLLAPNDAADLLHRICLGDVRACATLLELAGAHARAMGLSCLYEAALQVWAGDTVAS